MIVERVFDGKTYSYDYSPDEIHFIRRTIRSYRSKKNFPFGWYPNEKKTKETLDNLSDREMLEDFNVACYTDKGPNRNIFALYIPIGADFVCALKLEKLLNSKKFLTK